MANTKTPNKSAASAKKGAGGSKPSSKPASKATSKAAQEKMRAIELREQTASRQRLAIILVAVVALIYCIVFIEGKSVWLWLHSACLSFFGICILVWPLLLLYMAFVSAKDKPLSGVKTNIIGSVVLLTFLSALIHVLNAGDVWMTLNPDAARADYFVENGIWRQIVDVCEIKGMFRTGGIIGAVLGGIIAKCGRGAAIAVLVIITAAAFMLVTGITIVRAVNAFEKTAHKVGSLGERRAERAARRLERLAEEFDDEEDAAVPDVDPSLEEKLGIGGKFNPNIDVGPAPAQDAIEDSFPKDFVYDDPAPPVPDFSREHDGIIIGVLGNYAANPPGKQPEAVPAEKPDEKPLPKPPEPLKPVEVVPQSAVPDEEEETVEKPYKKPDLSCLSPPKQQGFGGHVEEIEQNSKTLIDTLKSFGVNAKIVEVHRGPSVTRYELQPAEGVKISKITSLADDLALRLAASGVRIEAPIPNKSAIGIEVPNKTKSTVSLREIIDTPLFQTAKSKLNVALGKDITGNVICADLAKMPHLLIAGTTGSGKSVCLNSMIVSILYNAEPTEVKMLMIDPKQVEFTVYNGIPHLMVPVISDARKAAGALGWAVTEMIKRYKCFSEKGVRDITGYNKLADKDDELERMSQILIFIDELSDLMMIAPNEVEESICRLAQMARAAGMHLVIATQRPSVDVITGIIKANIPSRIALSVSSQVDSRTILDMAGAEKLLGYGDMLFNPVGISKPVRVQGCFVSDGEVERVVGFIKNQDGEQHEYDDDIMDEIDRQAVTTKKKGASSASLDSDDGDTDEMLPKAIEVAVEAQQISTTMLQRKLKLGFARAARLVDEMEARGIVGPFEGSKPRQVRITKQQWMEMSALSPDKLPDVNEALEQAENEDDEE